MTDSVEEVVGEFSVLAKLSLGSQRLRLFVTTRRILVAHVGKRGAGGVITTSLLGRLGDGLEDLLKSGREKAGRKKLDSHDPHRILSANSDNFAIGYEDIVKVELVETPSIVAIEVVTRGDKLEFFTMEKLGIVERLLEKHLNDKLNIRRLTG